MKNINKKSVLRILAIVLLIGLAASAAWSVQTLRAFSSNILPQAGAAAALISLDLSSAAGAQPLVSFATPAPSRVVIRFNAECSVGGPDTSYVDGTIWVDPAGAAGATPVAPSSSDNALCSGNGTATFNDSYTSILSQVVAFVPAGVHTVRVTAQGIGAGAAWRIDDISLTVESDP